MNKGNWALAIEKIITRHDPALTWRAERLLRRGEVAGPPPPGVIAQQNADGGARCPYAETAMSSSGATSRMLCYMVFYGLGETTACRRGVEFAWQHQQPDGRWSEAPVPEAASPPPWFIPGHLPVDLWVTANMAAALAALGYGDEPRLHKAVAWTEQHLLPDGSFPGYIHTSYGMAAAQYRLGATERAETHLRRALAFLKPETDVHELLWGLLCFFIGSIPKEHPTVHAYLSQLADTQGEDGLWPTVYGDAAEEMAMEALELLHAYRYLT